MQGDRQGTRRNAGQIPERKGGNAAVNLKIHFDKSFDQKFSCDSLHYGLIPFACNVVALSFTVLKTK